ncbi:hypothetical protein Hanom_Chr11g00968661 [Helianthus anomalus]
MLLFGCAYLGPYGHFYHILLDKLFKGKKDSTTVAKKVVVEQLPSGPWNNLIFMLYYGFIIKGKMNQFKLKMLSRCLDMCFESDCRDLKNNLWLCTYVTIYAVRLWIHVKSKINKEYPAVQYAGSGRIGWINPRHVPLPFRVILQRFVAMCCGIFLNLRARSKTLTKD